MDELDQIIDKMIAEGQSDDDIQFVVGEWKAANNPAALARKQATERPAEYVREMISNVPGSALETGKNLVGGMVDLVGTAAKATGEVGSATGNAIRELVGLTPHYGGTENIEKLASIPGAVIDHYKGYLDPNERALRVRDNPVGLVADLVPVTKAGQGGVALGKAGIEVAKKAPARAVDVGLGVLRGSPIGAARGVAGHGPVNGAVTAVKTVMDRAAKAEGAAPGVVAGQRTGAAVKAQGPRLVPKPDIAKNIEAELASRLNTVAPAPSHTPAARTLEEVTAANLEDAAASPARAGATTEFKKPQPVPAVVAKAGPKTGTPAPKTGTTPSDAIQQELLKRDPNYLQEQVVSIKAKDMKGLHMPGEDTPTILTQLMEILKKEKLSPEAAALRTAGSQRLKQSGVTIKTPRGKK